MILHEAPGDLFAIKGQFFYAHCISADAKMGAGIARRFVREFPAITTLRVQELSIGESYQIGRVFNLVSKPRYFDKPTYKSLGACLRKLAAQCAAAGVTQLAIPRIGCGLDRLVWDKVRPLIERAFAEHTIEIVVRYI